MEQSLPVANTRPKPPRIWLQNTKERYWGQQFCQMERGISVRPTEITGWSMRTNFKAGPEYNGSGPFRLMHRPKFPEFWVEWTAPIESTPLCVVR